MKDLKGERLNDSIKVLVRLMRCQFDMPTETSACFQLLPPGNAHCWEARFGRMAGTIRGVNATTVLCANSKNVKIHSIAVDCTSSSEGLS